MAKDLPYFKFFVSEWNDGDITLEDYKTQGVFINVCSYYWSNECDITIEKLNKRFKNNLQEIEILFSTDLIKKDELGDSVDEALDFNDPVLVAFRAAQMKTDKILSQPQGEEAWPASTKVKKDNMIV